MSRIMRLSSERRTRGVLAQRLRVWLNSLFFGLANHGWYGFEMEISFHYDVENEILRLE